MAAPQYRLDAGTRTMVELKKETKKRLGHSPDDGDAMWMCVHTPLNTTQTTKSLWRPVGR